MKYYIIRHTDAEDDNRGSYGGAADDHLVESGKIFAKKIGSLLVKKNINIIYSSTYIRASETAELINNSLNVEIIKIFNLRERNSYGILSGIEKGKAELLFPEIFKRIEEMKNAGFKPSTSVETLPGAEIYLDFLMRIKDGFNQTILLNTLKNHKNSVIVTHGGVIWAFLNDILKIQVELARGEIIVVKGNSLDTLKADAGETSELKEDIKKLKNKF